MAAHIQVRKLVISSLFVLQAGIGLAKDSTLGETTSSEAEVPPVVTAVRIPFNVSAYTYHDLNRNGLYDCGDRAIAGVPVALTRPDGSKLKRRSNINGFANFTTQLATPGADIQKPGEYRFAVAAPDGWLISDDNAAQIIEFSKSAQARPGIVASRIPEPVGLMQKLTIRGQIMHVTRADESVPVPDAIVTAYGPNNTERKTRTDANGNFVIDAAPGSWTILADSSAGSRAVKRVVSMSDTPLQLSAIALNTERSANHIEEFENVTSSVISKRLYPDLAKV